MIKRKEAAPFGIKDKLGYLFGDFGNDFTFLLSSSFLLKFYTDVMQISAAVVGLVMMLARFADAFTDVTMGRRKIQALDFTDVRTCGNRILPDLPIGLCRLAYVVQNNLACCDLSSVGLYILYLNQHSLRLYGVHHFP